MNVGREGRVIDVSRVVVTLNDPLLRRTLGEALEVLAHEIRYGSDSRREYAAERTKMFDLLAGLGLTGADAPFAHLLPDPDEWEPAGLDGEES